MIKKIIVDLDENIRLDKYLSSILQDVSRSTIKSYIQNNLVYVNKKIQKGSYIVKINDLIEIYSLNQEKKITNKEIKTSIDILYEDEYLAIIDKPKGLIVHSGSGTKDSITLVDIIENMFNNLSTIQGSNRKGIVHRLDKDTTGIMIIAKDDITHRKLSKMFENHIIDRRYLAICNGRILEDSGLIDAPIKRSIENREKQEINIDGKKAITEFKVIQRFQNHTLVECKLRTGRTHQIRVHFNYIKKPILSDQKYGFKIPYDDKGQYLHSYYIDFIHPINNERIFIKTDLPNYFKETIDKLKI